MKRFFTLCFLISATSYAFAQAPQAKVTFEEYLKASVVSRHEVDLFLPGKEWATFDPQLGYVLGNSLLPLGIDHSSTIETVEPNGARRTLLYAGKKVRINTYGDSFTESMQVNDGETWQEYLAGHLGEPVRNFGVGGYGVYQAYQRMLREESTDHGAEYLILTICCDDSTRSLYRSRWAAIYPWFRGEAERLHLFHANFWSNVEMDIDTGQFVEKEQLLRTPDSLYRMTDPIWMAEHLKDDLALQLTAYSAGLIGTLDRKPVSRLAARLHFPFDWTLLPGKTETAGQNGQPMTPMQAQAETLLNRYSQRATIFILEKARDFADRKHRHLLVVLNYTTDLEKKAVRDDQEILEYLANKKFDYVDINQAFRDEFQKAKTTMSFEDYMKQYLVDGVGHLNPRGNHFVAYTLKDKVVSMLDPKPTPYQRGNAEAVNWDGYLSGGGYH